MKRVSPRRAVIELVLLVVAVDAVFVAAYFLAGIKRVPDAAKLVFTAVWTLVTLAVVIRGLSRLRSHRLDRRGTTPSPLR
jgi:hypothetical protein